MDCGCAQRMCRCDVNRFFCLSIAFNLWLYAEADKNGKQKLLWIIKAKQQRTKKNQRFTDRFAKKKFLAIKIYSYTIYIYRDVLCFVFFSHFEQKKQRKESQMIESAHDMCGSKGFVTICIRQTVTVLVWQALSIGQIESKNYFSNMCIMTISVELSPLHFFSSTRFSGLTPLNVWCARYKLCKCV